MTWNTLNAKAKAMNLTLYFMGRQHKASRTVLVCSQYLMLLKRYITAGGQPVALVLQLAQAASVCGTQQVREGTDSTVADRAGIQQWSSKLSREYRAGGRN